MVPSGPLAWVANGFVIVAANFSKCPAAAPARTCSEAVPRSYIKVTIHSDFAGLCISYEFTMASRTSSRSRACLQLRPPWVLCASYLNKDEKCHAPCQRLFVAPVSNFCQVCADCARCKRRALGPTTTKEYTLRRGHGRAVHSLTLAVQRRKSCQSSPLYRCSPSPRPTTAASK